MAQAKYQVAGKRPLEHLSTKALKELVKLGYSRRSLRRYLTIWQHLIEYSKKSDLGDGFSADLAASFSCPSHPGRRDHRGRRTPGACTPYIASRFWATLRRTGTSNDGGPTCKGSDPASDEEAATRLRTVLQGP